MDELIKRNAPVELVQQAIRDGANPNDADHNGISMLYLALRRRRYMPDADNLDRIIKTLVAAGARCGIQHLDMALEHSCATDVIQCMLDAGVRPNPGPFDGEPPLSTAIERRRFDVVDALLAAGANPNFAPEAGRSPLQDAVSQAPVAVVRSLVLAGANPRVLAPHDVTLLMLAAAGQSFTLEMLNTLVGLGLDPRQTNHLGNSLIHINVARGTTTLPVIRRLLELGVDPAHRNHAGQTALMVANVDMADDAVFGALVVAMVDIDAIDRSDNSALTHCIISRSPAARCSLLLAHHATPRAHDLHVCIRACDPLVMDALLRYGLPVDARYHADPHISVPNTPLPWLAWARERLRPVDYEDREMGRTPLHAAAAMGKVAGASCLLERNANVHAVDSLGRTALHWAAENDHRRVVEWLIWAKANVDAIDYLGQTPLDVASDRCRQTIHEMRHKRHQIDLNLCRWLAGCTRTTIADMALRPPESTDSDEDV